jgi:hypothetical protein
MKWVTRDRPKTDRIACPWLIRRFIDPDAEILYVPADQVLAVAEREGGNSFDAAGATYTHRGNACTFETLIDEYNLGNDPALVRLARIVHAADISDDLHSHPLGAGLLAIGIGASTSRATTTGSWNAVPSSTTRCTPGANVTWRPREPGDRHATGGVLALHRVQGSHDP